MSSARMDVRSKNGKVEWSPAAVDSHDARVLRLLVNAVALDSQSIQTLIRWWHNEQQGNESSLSFLVRQQMITPIQSQWLHLSAKGFLAAEQLPRLLGDGLRARLEARLRLVALASQAPSPRNLFSGN